MTSVVPLPQVVHLGSCTLTYSKLQPDRHPDGHAAAERPAPDRRRRPAPARSPLAPPAHLLPPLGGSVFLDSGIGGGVPGASVTRESCNVECRFVRFVH